MLQLRCHSGRCPQEQPLRAAAPQDAHKSKVKSICAILSVTSPRKGCEVQEWLGASVPLMSYAGFETLCALQQAVTRAEKAVPACKYSL